MNTIQLMLATIGAVIGIALGMGSLIAILIRYMLIPYLSEKFVLLEETHKQVSENSHINEAPTVLDRISEVKTQADRIEYLAKSSHDEVAALARMFDGHLDWSQKEVDAMWKAIERRRNRS